MSQRILPLSEHVISHLTSTKEIRDLKSAVLGLLENSLDAGASKVNITVNISKRSCVIEDNGHGIAAEAFDESGGLCKWHHTSKVDAVSARQAHSCHGTFLASLATLSYLCITSNAGDRASYLSLHHGRVLSRGLPPVSHELVKYPHGTRVFVDDIHGNLPVRVTQYALTMQSEKSRARMMDDLKHAVVALLLAWSQPCMVRLQEADNDGYTVTLAATHPVISHAVTSRALKNLGDSIAYSLQDKLQILFQAGLATSSTRPHWKAVSATSSLLTVKGLICSEPSPSSRCQFISLNVTALSDNEEYISLFERINKLFNRSSFAQITSEDDQTAQQRTDHHPMYVFEIICKEHTLLSSSSLMVEKVKQILCRVVQGWLEAHHYTTSSIRRTRSRMQAGPAAPLPTSESSIAGTSNSIHDRVDREHADLPSHTSSPSHQQPWTRIKSSRSIKKLPVRMSHPQTASAGVISPATVQQNYAEEHPEDAAGPDQYTRWRDPVSGHDILVNVRTGMTRPALNKSLPARGSLIGLSQERSGTPVLPDQLRDWTPPVFAAPREELIPRSYQHELLSDIYVGTRSIVKIAKSQLRQACVVAQVDLKFILCRLPDSKLILIDQHAASERILLERLLAELILDNGNINGVTLEESIVFETSEEEHRLFQRHIRHFEAWSLMYTGSRESQALTASQVRPAELQHRVSIHGLPAVIAERCRTSPKLIIDLLRSEVWKLAEDKRQHSFRPCSRPDTLSGPAWLRYIDQCPKALLELINSRACRSAIMFNDPLSNAQCVALINELGATCFPFMCAHGRTSIVPLGNLNRHEEEFGFDVDDFKLAHPSQGGGSQRIKFRDW